MTDLAGRVAIVTGASRGIGAAAAFVLAKAGAAVMIVARDGKRISQLAGEIVATGGRAAALACDVADYESVRKRSRPSRWCKSGWSSAQQLTLEAACGLLRSLP